VGVVGSEAIRFVLFTWSITLTSKQQKPKVLILMGPTASGKTGLGIQLAQALNGEIISVDSALVYKGMDIGTAKPSVEEQQGIPHHLLDIIEPTQSYSAGEFCTQAKQLIDDIDKRGKTPILVGGTMLYFHSLLEGMAVLPEADEAVRKEIDRQAQKLGWLVMHQQLAKIDPKAAARIHPNDPQRIQRALEVYQISGKTQTEWVNQQKDIELPFQPLKYAIAPQQRSTLHEKIALRFDLMLKAGFMDEMEGLYHRGDLTPEMPSMRSVGYRQAWMYLDGEYNAEQMRERSIIATRQLAKRQFTWLRKQQSLQWLETEDKLVFEKIMESIV